MIWWTAFLWASVCINGCDNPLWMMKEVVVVIQLLSCVWLLQPHGLAPQAPLSMGFLRQEYCSGLPFLSPEDVSFSGECFKLRDWTHVSCTAGEFFTAESQGKPSRAWCPAPNSSAWLWVPLLFQRTILKVLTLSTLCLEVFSGARGISPSQIQIEMGENYLVLLRLTLNKYRAEFDGKCSIFHL